VNDVPRLGEVVVRRYFDRKHQVVVADGYFTAFFTAYVEHVRRWEVGLDPLTYTMMRQGLAAATLHLSARPHDESFGFTLNFKEPPTNIFLTGDASSSRVTGRVFTEGVKTAESSRLFVQSQRPRHEQMQSMVEVTGLDVLEVFEQYYARSEQEGARFFEDEDDRFLMVLALPDHDRAWIQGLRADAPGEVDTANLDLLDERIFRFQCGCNPEKMMEALHTIFRDNPEDLFQGEGGVETFCPRCGSRWWIERVEYERRGGL
jgi:molecular chaperone Hsp33